MQIGISPDPGRPPRSTRPASPGCRDPARSCRSPACEDRTGRSRRSYRSCSWPPGPSPPRGEKARTCVWGSCGAVSFVITQLLARSPGLTRIILSYSQAGTFTRGPRMLWVCAEPQAGAPAGGSPVAADERARRADDRLGGEVRRGGVGHVGVHRVGDGTAPSESAVGTLASALASSDDASGARALVESGSTTGAPASPIEHP